VGARHTTRPDADDPRLAGLLQHVEGAERNTFPEALAIKVGAQYVVTRVADIDWIEADGNYAKVYIQKRPRLLTKSLATLEKDVLDPENFIRVHRSAIVNAARIASVEPQLHGDLTLLLHDGTTVQCSRRFRKRLEEKLYFTT
jgi:DNA-binding LytR/AlgR family response regulator